MLGALQPTHLILVIGIAILLFGAQRLPDAARSLGRSARILKAEISAGADAPAHTPTEAPQTNAAMPARSPDAPTPGRPAIIKLGAAALASPAGDTDHQRPLESPIPHFGEHVELVQLGDRAVHQAEAR
jgi:sec-independent protein translocase protein TatA